MEKNRKSEAGQHPLDRHPGLYRAQLACRIARDGIDGNSEGPTNAGVSRMEWAMFNLLHAVEEIATAMMPPAEKTPPAGKSTLGPLVQCNKVQERCAGCQHAVPHNRTAGSCAGWCCIGSMMRCRPVAPSEKT